MGARRRRLCCAFGLLAFPFVAEPAFGQTACSERESMSVELEKTFDETLTAFGLTPDGKVVEVHVSPESGSWTMLISFPDGMSCVSAFGSGWQQLKMEQKKQQS